MRFLGWNIENPPPCDDACRTVLDPDQDDTRGAGSSTAARPERNSGQGHHAGPMRPLIRLTLIACLLARAASPCAAGPGGALSGCGSSSAKEPLASLSSDPDPEVASVAKQALLGLEETQARMDRVKRKRAGDFSQKRSKMIRRLEKAARDGRLELGVGEDDLLTTLTSADIPLLNRARAAALGRLSDECLYEYYPLTYAARDLRGYLGRADADPEASSDDRTMRRGDRTRPSGAAIPPSIPR